jgi:hypothetical protein
MQETKQECRWPRPQTYSLPTVGIKVTGNVMDLTNLLSHQHRVAIGWANGIRSGLPNADYAAVPMQRFFMAFTHVKDLDQLSVQLEYWLAKQIEDCAFFVFSVCCRVCMSLYVHVCVVLCVCVYWCVCVRGCVW